VLTDHVMQLILSLSLLLDMAPDCNLPHHFSTIKIKFYHLTKGGRESKIASGFLVRSDEESWTGPAVIHMEIQGRFYAPFASIPEALETFIDIGHLI